MNNQQSHRPKPATPAAPAAAAVTAPAPDTASTPAPAAEPAVPAPEVTPASDSAAKETAPDWTFAMDFTLVGLKSQNKTWAEIGEAIPGKDKDALRARFKELQTAKVVAEEPKAESSAETKKDESKKEYTCKDCGKKNAEEKGKGKEKAQDKGKGKEKAEEKNLKSAMKKPAGPSQAKEGKEKVGDRPIIYVTPNDALDTHSVSHFASALAVASPHLLVSLF